MSDPKRVAETEPDYRCGLFKERVGYKGQRYEHSAFFEDQDRRRVLGWSNTKNDLAFSEMVRLRPGWSDYECKDLSAEAGHE